MNFLLLHERNEGPPVRVAIENINSYRPYAFDDEGNGEWTIISMKSETIYVVESVEVIDRWIVRAGGKLISDPPKRNDPPRTNQEP